MSVADQVKDHVEDRPYLQEALAEEIVNFSALARKIADDVDGGVDAVKMALRRHAETLQEQRRTRISNVGSVLDGTSIELRNNIIVCKTTTAVEDALVSAKTEHGYTAVLDGDQGCRGDTITGQVMITLKSSGSLEGTPGVLAYILSLFAGQDINITELISCREDTHIVIHEDDATKAFELLNEKLA